MPKMEFMMSPETNMYADYIRGFRQSIDQFIAEETNLKTRAALEKAKEDIDAGLVTPENFKEILAPVGEQFDKHLELSHTAGIFEPVDSEAWRSEYGEEEQPKTGTDPF